MKNPIRFRALLVVAGLLFAGCGFASPLPTEKVVGDGGSQALRIATASLPDAEVGTAYPATRLEAEGATGPVAFRVVAGRLPTGLTLAADGWIEGTPGETGHFAFDVEVDDGTAAADQTLAVDVWPAGEDRPLTLTIENLPLPGDAWAGEPVDLVAHGQDGPVGFAVVRNETGGLLQVVDGAAGRARWTPGATTTERSDRLLATDTVSGETVEVEVHVMPHPAADFQPGFGTSDVWHVTFTGRRGDHEYATDWDHVLAQLGLRGAPPADASGSDADRLASYYVRRQVVSWLNRYYLRDGDGMPGAGFPITFVLDRPEGHTAPAAGSLLAGRSDRYSVIAVTHGTTEGVLGLAYLDAAGNEWHENDSPNGGSGELGAFPNQVVAVFNATFVNMELVQSPVGASDVPALRALVYGLPYAGERYAELERIANGFARMLATTLAHEIGHSLGLRHTETYTPGSIMNASLRVSPSASYAFLPEDEAALMSALPGVGRRAGTTAAKLGGADEPAGGVCVCELHLEPGDAAHDDAAVHTAPARRP